MHCTAQDAGTQACQAEWRDNGS